MLRKKRKGSRSHRAFGALGRHGNDKNTTVQNQPVPRRQQGRGQRVSFAAVERWYLRAGLPTLIDIFAGAGNSVPTQLSNVNNIVFFAASNGMSGGELWKSDGTAAGTVMVKDARAGASSSNPYHLTNVNGTLFFRANDGASGVELWKSDGTLASTVRVKDIRAGSGSSKSELSD